MNYVFDAYTSSCLVSTSSLTYVCLLQFQAEISTLRYVFDQTVAKLHLLQEQAKERKALDEM